MPASSYWTSFMVRVYLIGNKLVLETDFVKEYLCMSTVLSMGFPLCDRNRNVWKWGNKFTVGFIHFVDICICTLYSSPHLPKTISKVKHIACWSAIFSANTKDNTGLVLVTSSVTFMILIREICSRMLFLSIRRSVVTLQKAFWFASKPLPNSTRPMLPYSYGLLGIKVKDLSFWLAGLFMQRLPRLSLWSLIVFYSHLTSKNRIPVIHWRKNGLVLCVYPRLFGTLCVKASLHTQLRVHLFWTLYGHDH